MRREDFDEFAQLLDAAFDLIGKTPAAKVISAQSKALFFQALAEYPLPAVRAALGEHIKRGKFTPTPADIVGYIEERGTVDNRPGSEEAWALALSTLDDVKTVVWTQEAAEAFGRAKPVLDSSGAISARKTFIEIYERLVAANRKARTGPRWFISPGSDRETYQLAVKTAVTAGFLPAPKEDPLPALAGPEPTTSLSPAEQLAAVRTLLLDGIAEKQRQADEEIDKRNQTEDEFNRTLSRRVGEYQAYIRIADQAQVVRAEVDRVQQASKA